ncbi:hypothetical protein VPHK406_0134 [Vibrio phage K406]
MLSNSPNHSTLPDLIHLRTLTTTNDNYYQQSYKM